MTPCTLRTFAVDVTPPVGSYLCGGLHDTMRGVETPLYLRGVVLDTGDARYVVAGIDYCYLVGRSQARLVEALAEGAGTPATHATLHSNHVHDAPLIDEEAHAVLFAETGLQFHDEAYFGGVVARTREAVAAAMARPGVPLGGVSLASHPVERFASSRRVLDDRGVCHVRWSVCRDEWVRDQPEGRIDPMLDQVVLYDPAGVLLACLHFYACHPQVSNGRGLASSDTVGVALDLFSQARPGTPGVFSIYFNGCGGDITAGKYTTLDRPRNRLVFGVRLYDGMKGAYAKAIPSPLGPVSWLDRVIELPLAPVAGDEALILREVRDPATPRSVKYLQSIKLDRLRRPERTYPFRVSRLRLGEIDLLFLPTELVSEYQFHAKAERPGRVAVAAYGDSYLKYVAADRHFDEGGYEVDPLWTEVGKGIERPIRDAITHVLK